MAKLFPVIRRVTTQIISGVTNWRADQSAGLSHDERFTISPEPQPVGLDHDTAPSSVRIAEPVGLDHDLIGATVTAAKPAQPAGLSHATRATVSPVPAPAGVDILQVTYDVDGSYGANAVVETAVAGRTDWASDANATGPFNGTLATIAGNALGARGGQLEFDYVDFPNKDSLTITSCVVDFHVRQAGTVGDNGDLRLKIDTGSGFVTVASFAGNVSNLVAPRTFDISGSISVFSDLNALRTAVSFESGVAELQTADVDAVVLRVTATATETY